MKKELICITCPNSCRMTAEMTEDGSFTVTGNTCKRGEEFAFSELTHPMRSLTTTVRTISPKIPVLPVRTIGEIPKDRIKQVMGVLTSMTLDHPVRCGELVAADVAGTGCDVIATLDMIV